jgi:hypothetical protein
MATTNQLDGRAVRVTAAGAAIDVSTGVNMGRPGQKELMVRRAGFESAARVRVHSLFAYRSHSLRFEARCSCAVDPDADDSSRGRKRKRPKPEVSGRSYAIWLLIAWPHLSRQIVQLAAPYARFISEFRGDLADRQLDSQG